MRQFKPGQLQTGSLYNISSSYAVTASFALNVGGTSIDTGSFATTGSNIFRGNQAITGSLNVTGSTTQIGNNTLAGNTTLSGSIIISGSTTTPATPTIKVYGDMETNGVIKFMPVTKNIDTSISASYVFVSGSTNDLYFSQNGSGYNNVTRLRWLEGNMYTGLLHGGLISSASSTTFNVSSGSGIIVNLNASLTENPFPTIQYVNWGNLTNQPLTYRTTAIQTFIGINSSGSIIQQTDPWNDGQYNTSISLGTVLHQNLSTINGSITYPNTAYGYKQRTYDFIKAFGPLKLSGYTLYTSSSLGLTVGSGTAFADGRNYQVDPNNPSYIVDAGTSVSKIFRYYVSASTYNQDTNAGAGYTVIDPAQYNNNGVLTSVPSNRPWSNQRVFYYPNSVTKGIVVYYGSATYASETEAIANLPYENFAETPNTQQNAIYLGAITIRYNGVFTNPNDYTVLPGGIFRSVGGSGGGGAISSLLSGLSDVIISGPTDGQPLVYDTTAAHWKNSSTLTATLTGNASTATTASYALTANSSSYADRAEVAGAADIYSFGADVDSYILMSNVIGTTGVAIGGDTDLRYNSSTNKLTVGSVSATSLSGSLFGTASYSMLAQTASYVLQSVSASYAPDTTFPYTGSARITGSLGVTGSVSILAYTASADPIFNVRNSANTQNLMTISGDGQVVIGLSASINLASNASPQETVVIGRGAVAGLNGVAVGGSSQADWYGSVAVGKSSRAGITSVAIGGNAIAFNSAVYPTLAIGYNTNASGIYSGIISVGDQGANPVASSIAFGINNTGNNQSLFFNRNTNIVLRSNTALTSGTHFDANATNTITIHSGSIPTTIISGSVQMYAATGSLTDNTRPHFRTGNGTVVWLGDQSQLFNVTASAVTASLVTATQIGVGTAPSGSVRLDVRAQGALSTDIAMRVRNSGNTYDILAVNGDSSVQIGSDTLSNGKLTIGAASTPILNLDTSYSTDTATISVSRRISPTYNTNAFLFTQNTFSDGNVQPYKFHFVNPSTYWGYSEVSFPYILDAGYMWFKDSATATNLQMKLSPDNALQIYSSSRVWQTTANAAPIETYVSGGFQLYASGSPGSVGGNTIPYIRTENQTLLWLGSQSRLHNVTASNMMVGATSSLALFTSINTTVNTGTTTIYTFPTASYDGAFIDYTARSGSNARAGQLMGIWSGSAVNYTETTTTDFGSTTGITFGMSVSASSMIVSASATTSGWTVKTIIRSM